MINNRFETPVISADQALKSYYNTDFKEDALKEDKRLLLTKIPDKNPKPKKQLKDKDLFIIIKPTKNSKLLNKNSKKKYNKDETTRSNSNGSSMPKNAKTQNNKKLRSTNEKIDYYRRNRREERLRDLAGKYRRKNKLHK